MTIPELRPEAWPARKKARQGPRENVYASIGREDGGDSVERYEQFIEDGVEQVRMGWLNACMTNNYGDGNDGGFFCFRFRFLSFFFLWCRCLHFGSCDMGFDESKREEMRQKLKKRDKTRCCGIVLVSDEASLRFSCWVMFSRSIETVGQKIGLFRRIKKILKRMQDKTERGNEGRENGGWMQNGRPSRIGDKR